MKAGAVFREQRIRAHGYRCPYLSATEALPDVIPDGLVQYSSNEAIWWDALPASDNGNAIITIGGGLYGATPLSLTVK